MARPTRPGNSCAGYAYLAVLLGIAITGLAVSAVATVWHEEIRREREHELLFVGDQFRRAILQYYENSPNVKRYPVALEDLLQDARYATTRRYLRQVYRDPMTGKTQWGLVRAPEGGIMGVYSLGPGTPLRRKGFPEFLQGFDEAKSYQEWKFVYRPTNVITPTPSGR